MPLTGTITANISLTHTKASDLSTPVEAPISPESWLKWTVADGTGAGQADLIFHDTRTLALSTSENLDLSGSLVDVFGLTLAFARIKALYISTPSTNGGNIVVGGAAANGWIGFFGDLTDKIKLPASSGQLIIAEGATGWPVTAGTADILKIENDDGAAEAIYDILIMGASA